MSTEATQKRRGGRPKGSLNRKGKMPRALSVRMTPVLFAYLQHLYTTEGFTFSDSARAMLIESMKARGVFPTTYPTTTGPSSNSHPDG